MIPNSKILVILGPTATGKSDLAVLLAEEIAQTKWDGFNGAEIISADSRQVYRGLNIGSGKITKKEMRGIPHHLLDVSDPRKRFNVAKYQELAREKIAAIFSRQHLPIICGGTGFYISALVDGIILPDVPPNEKLRVRLMQKSTDELIVILKKLDPARAKTVDQKNPRRLIRAIEIAIDADRTRTKHGQCAEKEKETVTHPYNALWVGLTLPREELKKKIAIRLSKRLKAGMIAEAKKLHVRGLSWKRMEELGLEYRYLARLLQNKITREEFVAQLSSEIWRFSKRQMTWFRREKRVKWFKPGDHEKISSLVKNFLAK